MRNKYWLILIEVLLNERILTFIDWLLNYVFNNWLILIDHQQGASYIDYNDSLLWCIFNYWVILIDQWEGESNIDYIDWFLMCIFNYWVILIDEQHRVSIIVVYWLIIHSWVHTFISHKSSRRCITVILFFKMKTSDLFTHNFISPKCKNTNITFIFKMNSST